MVEKCFKVHSLLLILRVGLSYSYMNDMAANVLRVKEFIRPITSQLRETKDRICGYMKAYLWLPSILICDRGNLFFRAQRKDRTDTDGSIAALCVRCNVSSRKDILHEYFI